MKTWLKFLAVAAAFGLGPAALAQQAPAASAPAAAAPGTPNPAQAPEGRVGDTATTQPQAGANPAAAPTPTPATATPAGQPAYSQGVQPTPGIGQPDGRMGLQDQFSPIGREAAGFHDYILMPAITIISLIVLGLMLYVILRFRRAVHPVPSRTTHTTPVEVLWTLIPVLLLVVIAVPSIRLLAHQ